MKTSTLSVRITPQKRCPGQMILRASNADNIAHVAHARGSPSISRRRMGRTPFVDAETGAAVKSPTESVDQILLRRILLLAGNLAGACDRLCRAGVLSALSASYLT